MKNLSFLQTKLNSLCIFIKTQRNYQFMYAIFPFNFNYFLNKVVFNVWK